MADRFWVGGTNNVNAANVWASTSGGAGGASAPGTGDRAIFDGNSGNVTVTINANQTIGSFSCTAGTGDFPGTITGTSVISCGNGGTFQIAAGTTWSYTGNMQSRGTVSLTTNGKTLNSTVSLNTWSLQDDVVNTGAWSSGVTTNGKNFTVASFATTVVSDISNSLVTLTATSGTAWSAPSSFTGTGSTIKLTGNNGAAMTFAGAGKTYGTVWYAGGSGGLNFSGSNTIGKLKCSAGLTMRFTAGTTTTLTDFPEVNGVYNGTKTTLNSVTNGSAWTISKATGVVVCDWLSLRDSTATGGATFYANQSTNTSGNTGWIFGAPGETIPAVKGNKDGNKHAVGRGGTSLSLLRANFGSFYGRARRRYVAPEQATTLITQSLADTLLPKLSEASAILTGVARSDSLTLTLAETNALLAALTGSDTAILADTAAAAIAASVARTDTVTVAIAEIAALVAGLARTDQLAVSVAEAAAVLVALARGDSVMLAIADAAGLAAVLARADSLPIAVDDVAAALAEVLARTDVLTVRLDEALVAAVLLARADSAGIGLDELAAIAARVAPGDQVTVDLDEDARIAALFAAIDGLAVGILDEAGIAGILATLVLGGIDVRPLFAGAGGTAAMLEGDPASAAGLAGKVTTDRLN